MTCHRNYLYEAYKIAESTDTEIGMPRLPERRHITALVEVIENQRLELYNIGKVIIRLFDKLEADLEPIENVYSEDDFKAEKAK